MATNYSAKVKPTHWVKNHLVNSLSAKNHMVLSIFTELAERAINIIDIIIHSAKNHTIKLHNQQATFGAMGQKPWTPPTRPLWFQIEDAYIRAL